MARTRRRRGDPQPDQRTYGWFENLSLSTKTQFNYGGLVAIFLLVCVAFVVAQSFTQSARRDAQLVSETLSSADQLNLVALNLLRLLRVSVYTQQPQYLEEFRATLTEYDSKAAELRRLVLDNAAQQVRLSRLDDVMARWQSSIVAPLVEMLQDPVRRLELASNPAIATQSMVDSGLLIDELESILDDFKSSERALLITLNESADRANRLATWTAAGGALLCMLGAFVGLRSSRNNIIAPLDRLTLLVSRITTEDADLRVPYAGRLDEIGAFARALTTLQEAVRARAHQNWIKTQLSALAGALQSCATHEQFGHMLLRGICRALEAPYGLAYRWDDDSQKLWWCAGFGVPDESVGARTSIPPGVGLVGQAFTDRDVIVVHDVRPEHFRFVTGAGFSHPASILFMPLISRGEVIAVLEIGLFSEPRPYLREFLDEAVRASAVSWQTLARSLRTLELLQTTQAQAEELQASEEAMRAQQEELRTTNETLRDRTLLLEEQQRRLKSSEEELRAQAEELRVSNSALEQRTDLLRQRQAEVELARSQLERRAEELEQASRYKSEFLANMSHELRTPLNSLLILSKGLADNEEGNLNSEQVESAQIVYDSGKNLLNLINDILDLSKVEAGKMQLVLEDLNLVAFAQMQERNFHHVARSHGVVFEVQLEPGLPETIHTDGTRLGQIVVNLLSNAFKFTQQGSVSLTIGRPTPGFSARMKGLDASRALYFAVSDTGIGIEQERIEQVFLPFEQADGSTSRRFGGTGLGLSIVRGMAQLLGGEVQVQSEPGEGSIFTLLVPDHLKDEPGEIATHAAPAPVSVSRPAPVGEAAVLIVEDDPAFSNILSGIVARKGVRGLCAATGAEALALAFREPISAVLLDLGLPDMSGWEVLNRLKQDPRTRDVPVHVISARDESSRGLAMGALSFLVKPVTKDAVMDALDQVCRLPGQGQRRVLLVDDDPISRRQVHKLLEQESVEIVDAIDGGSGLRAFEENATFDCVILDLGLPDMSGFEWLERLSERTTVPPVVIYSARDLTPDENLKLRGYTESIVIKGVRSPERLLDEVSLFLYALKPPTPGVSQAPVHGAPSLAPASVAASDGEPPAQGIAGKTVLVVDDDMRNVFALSKALRSRGLHVLMAQDGYKALTQIETHPEVDIVLMDIMMPGMDGFETMRRIRSNPDLQKLPIIAVTAKAMIGDREKCLEAGANDYCSKPIDMDQLLSQIRVWV